MDKNSGTLKYILVILILAACGVVIFTVSAVAGSSAGGNADESSNTLIKSSAVNPSLTYAYTSKEDMWCKRMGDLLQISDPVIASYARLHVDPDNSEEKFTMAQACDLYDGVNEEWKYLSDPAGPDYIASAKESLRGGLSGDCDDYSVFLASLMISIGGNARIVTVYDVGGKGGHAYPEILIGYSQDEAFANMQYIYKRYGCSKVWCTVEDDAGMVSYWLNMDWVLQKSPVDYKYYMYGVNTNEVELFHPGKEYYLPDRETVCYSQEGTYKKSEVPQHKYYTREGGYDRLN